MTPASSSRKVTGRGVWLAICAGIARCLLPSLFIEDHEPQENASCALVFAAGRDFGIKHPMLWFCRVAFLLVCLLALDGCAASDPDGVSDEPDSPALPIDPHPAAPATFTNRTDHTTLSD